MATCTEQLSLYNDHLKFPLLEVYTLIHLSKAATYLINARKLNWPEGIGTLLSPSQVIWHAFLDLGIKS